MKNENTTKEKLCIVLVSIFGCILTLYNNYSLRQIKTKNK